MTDATVYNSVESNGAKLPLPRRDTPTGGDKKRIVISVSPHTAGVVETARALLTADGYNVSALDVGAVDALTFPARLDIETAAGVLDLTLTGLADQLLGGAQRTGLLLLELAGQAGVPIVLAPGGLDMVTFPSREAIPPQWARRKFSEGGTGHILMRTDTSENARMGRLLAEKVNQARGPVAVALPLRGLSDLSAPGEPFSSAEISMALFGNLTTHLRRDIRLYDSNVSINDPAFAQLCVEALKALMQTSLF